MGVVKPWNPVRGVRGNEAKGWGGVLGDTGGPDRRRVGSGSRTRPPNTFRKAPPAPEALLKLDAASFNPGMQLTW